MEKVSFKLELTMRELLNAALGHQQLTKDNFKILRLFIDILLEKLNCADEEVTITGATALCLEQLRRTAQIPGIPANTEGVFKFGEKFQQIEKFEKDLGDFEARYEGHMNEIRAFNRVQDEKFQCVNWEKYSTPCEELCTLPKADDKVACDLIQNAYFIYSLRERLSFPMQRRMEKCNAEVEVCGKELKEIGKYVKEESKKFALVDLAVSRIEKIRKAVTTDYNNFYEAVEEIQAMLDAKLDKVHMPALKLYVKITTNNIHKILKDFYKPKDCRRADKKRIVSSEVCLSCSCQTSVRQFIEFKYPPANASYCGCTGLCLNSGGSRTLMDFMKNFNLDEYVEKASSQGGVPKVKSPMYVTTPVPTTVTSVVRFN